MSCGCAKRMRWVLRQAGYHFDPADSVWKKEGALQEFPDSRIEEDHFRVLIETLADEMAGNRAANFLRKLGR